MATQQQTAPESTNPLQLLAERAPLLWGIGFIAVATIFLLAINRSMLWFPLLSSIAFPMLAVSPFVVFALKIDTKIKIFLILIVALLIVPYLGLKDTFYLELAIQIGIFAALALGLNIVVGFAGLLDLGYVAFFAVGAYLWGIFASQEAKTIIKLNNALASPDAFYIFLFLGVGAAALAGVLLGLPVLRLKGDYLAIVTLGFGEIIRVFLSNLSNVSSDPKVTINITNGAQGLANIADPTIPAFVFDMVAGIGRLLNIPIGNVNSMTYQLFFYVLVLILGLILATVAARLDNSAIGRAWTAIREDEVAARAMGVPLVKMKLLAFATGASFAGAMGVVFAAKQTFVSPESFSFNQSIFILVIVIVGGMGSIRGVILGAIAVTLLNIQVLPNLSLLLNSLKTNSDVLPSIQDFFKAWPNQLEPAKYQRFVFGILLVLMMIFRPAGILPASRRKREIEAQMKDASEPPSLDLEPEPLENPHTDGLTSGEPKDAA